MFLSYDFHVTDAGPHLIEINTNAGGAPAQRRPGARAAGLLPGDRRFDYRPGCAWMSTIDSAFLLAGALTAGNYFDADTADEHEIRTLADALYRRADWQWAQNQGATVTHGWTPKADFSNTAGKATTKRCCCTSWGWVRRLIRCLRAVTRRGLPRTGGKLVMDVNISLFTHQLSHVWIDFRGI